MRITQQLARKLTELLETEQERIRHNPDRFSPTLNGVPRTTLWERDRRRVNDRLQELPVLVQRAAAELHIERGRGRKPTLDPAQKTMLFLFARITQRSNRDMEALLAFLGPVFEVSVGYKTIERLYSDEEVELVLNNLFVLLLKEAGVSGHTAGDGTGYSLQAGENYRSDPEKSHAGFRCVFRLVDLETGMYVAYGYSDVSEKAAFKKAIRFVEREGLPMDSVRLDKYYSSRKTLRELGKDVEAFVLPKKNLASFGTECRKVFERIDEDHCAYLDEYCQQELAESYSTADKEQFGRTIHQVRADRREMATAGLAVHPFSANVRQPSD